MKRRITFILIMAFVFSLGFGFAVVWAGPGPPGVPCDPNAICCHLYDCPEGCSGGGNPGFLDFWGRCRVPSTECHCWANTADCYCP
jgi:hypothetical protein